MGHNKKATRRWLMFEFDILLLTRKQFMLLLHKLPDLCTVYFDEVYTWGKV